LTQNVGYNLATAQPPLQGKVESAERPAAPGATGTQPVTSQKVQTTLTDSPIIVYLVALYVFLLESRVLDLSPIWWMHIPMMLLILLIVLTIAKGNFRVTFTSNISRGVVLLTAWVALCVPFSMWRFASMDPLQSQIQALLIFVIIVQAIRTPNAYRKITGAYAYAVLVASVMGFFLGHSVENGRLALAGGTLADPNEFAFALVVGLPFWWDKAHASRGPKKLIYLACTIPIFITFGKTGSRSGLFTLLMLLAVTLYMASGTRKIMIAFGCLILVAASSVLLPDYIRARYVTIFSPASNQQLDSRENRQLQSDINSTEGRKGLLIQSIQLTFQHPIFGVGPGVFSYASFDQRVAASGHGGLAQVTHNTYTQISSETGLPGFLIFLGTILMVLKSAFSTYRTLKDTDSRLASSGKYLFSMLMAASVGMFFLSVGYTHTVTTLWALAVALANLRIWQASETHATSAAGAQSVTSFASPSPFRALPEAVSAQVRTPLANSKALRRAGVNAKRSVEEPFVDKSS
jgi:O-antigen ligase